VTVQSVLALVCDRCGITYSRMACDNRAADLRREAKTQGWSWVLPYRGAPLRMDLCAACSPPRDITAPRTRTPRSIQHPRTEQEWDQWQQKRAPV
jgi:hypothetical protein